MENKKICKNGPIAQLGARLNGIEKVESSNLSGSTISNLRVAFLLKIIEKVWSLQEASHSSNLSGSTTSSLRAAFSLSPLQWRGSAQQG